MAETTIVCARCTVSNHVSTRFCAECGLPLGSALPDAVAGVEALGPYEAPEPADPDTTRVLRDLIQHSGFEATPSGHGWRVVVPLQLDRRQAVYAGYAGTDPEGRSILSLVSVSGPANDRDARKLLKLNARVVEGHFAIRVLRGEEYFVVIENLPADTYDRLDPAGLFRRIAEAADGLEDRLSRGLDLY
ncbi:MAG: YbjN domain-containing protein [Planctomycetia bacterium]|nr:YbjN domain-containing protein [Planctomycetia bacterium]